MCWMKRIFLELNSIIGVEFTGIHVHLSVEIILLCVFVFQRVKIKLSGDFYASIFVSESLKEF